MIEGLNSRHLRRAVLPAAVLLLLLMALPLGARGAGGHPGPDVFLFYELRIERGRLFLLHETRWTDLACREIETYQGDADHDGVTSEAEAKAFAEAWAETVKRTFRVEIQGRPVELGEAEVRVDRHTPSEADQERRRAMEERGYENITDLSEFEGISDEFRVYLDFEIPLPAEEPISITLVEVCHFALEEMGFPLVKITNAFTAYGEEGSGISFRDWTPPDDPAALTEEIELEFDWSGAGPSLVEWAEWVDPDRDFKQLMMDVMRGKTGLWFGILVALLYGAAHAFAPGHGKALVGAYLIGTRGRVLDAVWLGLIVTVTHTISIIGVSILIGFVFHISDRSAVDRWIAVGSGLAILSMGLWLLWKNARAVRAGRPAFGHHHAPGHDHGHDHEHGHGQSHHDHRLPASFRELLWLGVSGGAVPCAGAMWVFLLALQHDYAWAATLMVGSFSLGLAVVLVAIGLIMVTSTKGIERLAGSRARMQWILLMLPFASAMIIIGVGTFLTYLALGI